VMSDLQCPARVVLATCDTLPQLASGRYSGVFVAPAVESAASDLRAASELARHAGCEIQRLQDAIDGAKLRRALNELSDVYRGETIVAVVPEAMLREVIGGARDCAKPVFVAIDSDGWTVLDAS